jgi:hypothetical protein
VTALAFVLAPVACSLVLGVSGAAKVNDVAATRAAFTAMDVPSALRGYRVVRTLPFVELALGLALLLTWSWLLAVVGGVVTALFATYWVLVARVLRTGEQVHCNCFGTIGDDRITRATLARNSVLVVLAAVATAYGAAGSGVLPALRDFQGTDWWWLVMAALVAAAAVLVISPGRPAEPERVPDEELLDYRRQVIPFGMLQDEHGGHTTLRQLAAERPQLLVFLSVGCGACNGVAAQLPEWSARLGPVQLSAVHTTPLDALPDELKPTGVRAWLDVEGAVTAMFGVGRPSAVLLGADRLLAGGPVAGARAVGEFVQDILAELAEAMLPEEIEPDDHDHADHADHDHEAEASA